MIRRLFLTGFAVFLLALACEPAKADPVILFTGNAGTGATAQVFGYTLTGNTFTFSVRNTSTSTSITALGFDLTSSRPNSYTLTDTSDADFRVRTDINVQAGAQTGCGVNCGVFDVALCTGNNFGGGSVLRGIQAGATATFTITGDFSGMTAQQVAQSLSLRFQGIGPSDLSDVADPSSTSPSAPPSP